MVPLGTKHLLPKQLPRPVAPLPKETLESYLRRLCQANQIQPAALLTHMTGTHRHTPHTIDGLAATVGRSVPHLHFALPELRFASKTEAFTALAETHTQRPICYRCAAQRGVFDIAVVWQANQTHASSSIFRFHRAMLCRLV